MIAIIDYDAGNLKSVEKALAAVGQESVITRDFQTILSADKVILPGAVLEQWNSIAIESFPYSIQKTDIAEMSSGKLEITWSLSDGTEQKQVQDVTFNKQ